MDQIRIAFIAPDGALIVTEHMQGWTDLIEQLPTFLPGTPKQSEWFAKVVFPAFVTNATQLFSRSTVPAHESQTE
jgi:hypothetical protein